MMNNKLIIVNIAILALISIVGLSVQQALVGSVPAFSLQPADPLVGQVVQGLGPSAQGTLMVPGQDFTITTKYFDNNTWAVASINPLHQAFDPSKAVLEEKDGVYQLELGPGTAFYPSQLNSLPQDVAAYLNTGGPSNGSVTQ